MDKSTVQFLIEKYEKQAEEKQKSYEFYRNKPNNRKDYTMSIKTTTCDSLYYTVTTLKNVIKELKEMIND